ncbi:MAG: ribosome biogenesis GTP-binding protein YihA/YsxC [Woeseiaceae bacterium]|nr:ribosome biogenesis GTP-binding protein YihA/YsxC [Woeseiaceae bacterium]
MSQYPAARFLLSANAPAQFVADEGVEVAVAGRSNAGKSSAINVIVNRRQFARTSKTPGRTQLINFFELAPGARLVDLPGYGYAKVTEDVPRDHWGRLIPHYFEGRASLRGLLLVVDVRRGLTDFDRQLLALCDSVRVPVHVLLTKADKLKRGQAATALLTARRELGEASSAQLFSALKRSGVEEARERLAGFLAAQKNPADARRRRPGVVLPGPGLGRPDGMPRSAR